MTQLLAKPTVYRHSLINKHYSILYTIKTSLYTEKTINGITIII